MQSRHTSSPAYLRVLVVDDDATWVETLVERFKRESIEAEGVSKPSTVFNWTTPGKFLNFDMIFLDMRLGPSKSGDPISAADVLLHIKTYCPTAKAVVFTQKELTVEECVRCIQLGALGFIPKMSAIDQFVLVANVYGKLGDEEEALEERIHSLWVKLEKEGDPAKGRHLEMLTTNLFNSIPGFKVITNNSMILPGEIDLVVENGGDHQFWKTIESFHIVVECKNQKAAAEKEIFNVLAQKVAAKGMCNVGILVSWSGVSNGFREMQRAESGKFKIFALDRVHLHELVRRNPDAREANLRAALESQV